MLLSTEMGFNSYYVDNKIIYLKNTINFNKFF